MAETNANRTDCTSHLTNGSSMQAITKSVNSLKTKGASIRADIISILKNKIESNEDLMPTTYPILNALFIANGHDRLDYIGGLLASDQLASADGIYEDILLETTDMVGFPSVMAALADLQKIRSSAIKTTEVEPVQLHPVMNRLYGAARAQQVFDRLQQISPRFNILCQKYAYGAVWDSREIGLFERSVVTIATLLTLNREEQLIIHLHGFRNVGGDRRALETIVRVLLEFGFDLDRKKISEIWDTIESNDVGVVTKSDSPMSVHEILDLTFGPTKKENQLQRQLRTQFGAYAGNLRLERLISK